MTNTLKTKGEIAAAWLIENQLPEVLSLPSAPTCTPAGKATPFAFPALRAARATPGGAIRAKSLSPSLRPHSAFSGQGEGGK